MFTFRVRPDDAAEFELVATSRDVVMWEKTTPGRSFANLREAEMSDFYGIAFAAARRQGLWPGTRQEFDAAVDIDIVEDDDEPDPTSPAP